MIQLHGLHHLTAVTGDPAKNVQFYTQVQTENDGIHDDPAITSLMMVTDPTTVRYEQRVAAGLATINGVSIAPKEEAIEMGRKLLAFRVERTADAIRRARSGS